MGQLFNPRKVERAYDQNKKKPRKVGGFTEKLKKAMEAAEAQKKLNQKGRN